MREVAGSTPGLDLHEYKVTVLSQVTGFLRLPAVSMLTLRGGSTTLRDPPLTLSVRKEGDKPRLLSPTLIFLDTANLIFLS
jgi:hypothetical protein